MRKNYDFSKSRANPYAKRLKKQVTIRLDDETITYFKGLAGKMGVAYQVLIDLYLRECAHSKKVPRISWEREKHDSVTGI